MAYELHNIISNSGQKERRTKGLHFCSMCCWLVGWRMGSRSEPKCSGQAMLLTEQCRYILNVGRKYCRSSVMASWVRTRKSVWERGRERNQHKQEMHKTNWLVWKWLPDRSQPVSIACPNLIENVPHEMADAPTANPFHLMRWKMGIRMQSIWFDRFIGAIRMHLAILWDSVNRRNWSRERKSNRSSKH